MRKLKVLYVSDCGMESSVFPSQVLGMVGAWQKVADVSLLYRSRWESDIPSIAKEKIYYSKALPGFARPLYWLEKVLNNWDSIVNVEYDVIHCRGVIMTWMVLESLRNTPARDKCKVIFDCRGVIVEELDYTATDFIRKLLKPVRRCEFRSMERTVTKNANIVLSVSNTLSEYLFKQYGRKADTVIPCIVDSDKFRFSAQAREEIRRRLGLRDERIFIYIGSTFGWQRVDLLKIWWEKHCQYHPDDILVVLTGKPTDFAVSIGWDNDVNKHRVIICSVPHNEVSQYLAAADFGILFRDETIVNKVASPIKLSEYLAAGLKVLTNQEYLTMLDAESILVNDKLSIENKCELISRSLQERVEKSNYFCYMLSADRAIKEIIKL